MTWASKNDTNEDDSQRKVYLATVRPKTINFSTFFGDRNHRENGRTSGTTAAHFLCVAEKFPGISPEKYFMDWILLI